MKDNKYTHMELPQRKKLKERQRDIHRCVFDYRRIHGYSPPHRFCR